MKINFKILILFLTFFTNVCFSQLYKDLKLFSNVLNHVKSNYLYERNSSVLVKTAINGLLNSLDPHCIYLNSHQFEKLMQITLGKSFGLGIEFTFAGESVIVISVADESEAKNSGILPGDVLKKINDVPILNKTLPEIKIMLYGEKESSVELEFYRHIDESSLTIDLKREEIEENSISRFLRLENNTVYINCTNFSSTTADEFYETLDKIDTNSCEKVIIDLRNNPGGQLENTINVAKLFLAKGDTISKTIGRKEDIDKIYINEEEKFFHIPAIILVNRSSASASELLAGTLQDNDRALIMGTNTFGKGLIQGTFLLDDGGALLLTIGKYSTPSGRIIQRPYEDKSFDQYYNEIYNTNNTNYTNRPKFKSNNNRILYGGGGIIPDIFIDNVNPITDTIDIEDLKLYCINFSTIFLRETKNFDQRFKYFTDYKEKFFLTQKIFKDINSIVKKNQNSINNVEFNQEVASLIKATIAEIIWGKEAAFIVLIKDDELLSLAISMSAKDIKDHLNPKKENTEF